VSDHSAHRPKAKLLRIELSDLLISEENSVEPRRDQFESQFLEAKDFADEDPVFMPADVPCVVHSSLATIHSGTMGVYKRPGS
jgi:hypothetical protein